MKTKSKQVLNELNQPLPKEIENSFNVLEKILQEKYPFGIPRKEIGKATGGILHPRTCANLDCLKQGIPGRFKCGRNTIYPVQSVIYFLQSKMTTAA